MGKLTDVGTNLLLDHVLKTTAYSGNAPVWVGLSTTTLAATDTTATEPVGNGYARVLISFGAADASTITQDAIATFPEASGSWGEILDYAIFDAETVGNMLAYGTLSASKTVISGNTPSIASSAVVITLGGEISTYLANALLNHAFDNTDFTVPTDIYVALTETAAITASSIGADINELDMTGYARVVMNAWNAASTGVTANTSLIDFGALTAGGPETVIGAALVDSASGAGNILFFDNGLNQIIGDGDTVQFAAGAFDITMDT